MSYLKPTKKLLRAEKAPQQKVIEPAKLLRPGCDSGGLKEMHSKSTAAASGYKSEESGGEIDHCSRQPPAATCPYALQLPSTSMMKLMTADTWEELYKTELQLVRHPLSVFQRLARSTGAAFLEDIFAEAGGKAKESGISASTRQSVVRWIYKVVTNMGWSLRTFFNAVHIMDTYMAEPARQKSVLFRTLDDISVPLLSTASLFIAVSCEEQHGQVMKAAYFVGQIPHILSVADIYRGMIEILKGLPSTNTSLNKTPADFIDFFLANMRDSSSFSSAYNHLISARLFKPIRDGLQQLAVHSYLFGIYQKVPMSRMIAVALMGMLQKDSSPPLHFSAEDCHAWGEQVLKLDYVTQLDPAVTILMPFVNEAAKSQYAESKILRRLSSPEFFTRGTAGGEGIASLVDFETCQSNQRICAFAVAGGTAATTATSVGPITSTWRSRAASVTASQFKALNRLFPKMVTFSTATKCSSQDTGRRPYGEAATERRLSAPHQSQFTLSESLQSLNLEKNGDVEGKVTRSYRYGNEATVLDEDAKQKGVEVRAARTTARRWTGVDARVDGSASKVAKIVELGENNTRVRRGDHSQIRREQSALTLYPLQ